MIISLNINNSNEITYNSDTNELSQQYIKINNNLINLYVLTNYNIYFEQTANNEIYYYVFAMNHKLYNKTIINNGISYNYYYGIIEPIFDSNTLKINKIFNESDKEVKYSYYLFKLTKDTSNNYTVNTLIKSGILKLEKSLIYLKCNFNNEKLVLDLSNEITKTNSDNIQIINKYESTKSIILYNNYNYLIHIDNNTSFGVYNEIFENYDKVSITETNINSELIKIDRKMYKWQITNNISSYTGDLIVDDFEFNNNNAEILEDCIFRDINILTKLYFDEFIYPEHKNIIKINNITNHLEINYSNKLLIIDNINTKKMDIILPSTNVSIGIVYKILLLTNLIGLNLKFEDSELNNSDSDIFKGRLNISNVNTKKNKTLQSDFTISNNIKIIDSTNTISLNNIGLNKYGYIEIYCSDKINNKFCWNINGELLNNNNNNINNVFI